MTHGSLIDDIADAKETLKEAIERAANDRKGRGYTIGPKTPLAVWLTWKEWKSILAAAGGDERRVPVDAGEGGRGVRLALTTGKDAPRGAVHVGQDVSVPLGASLNVEIPYPVLIIQVLDCPNNEGWDDEDKDAHRHFVYFAPRKPVCELAVERVRP